ncbi:hypothetical protein RCH21_003346 [Arthrobacter sp. PL16]|uniref:hypothetical protein n=1 Tax=Arthrobacter sp. PL16 TaxID=3071720 RepID=UPI002E0B7DF8|nr:hypothetical protein [Arthrobacter sp. PL16]
MIFSIAFARDRFLGLMIIGSEQGQQGMVRAMGAVEDKDQPADESSDARLQLRVALALTGYDVSDLWVAYFGITGALTEQDITAWLLGREDLPRSQVALVSLAADELLQQSGFDLRVSSQTHNPSP